MRPRVYPESNVGRRVATRGRNSRDYGAEPREPADHPGWEQLKVEVRALLDRGYPSPAGFDRQTLEHLLGADHIEGQTEEMLRLWVAANPPIILGVPIPGGRAES